jgi:hypothetical protein
MEQALNPFISQDVIKHIMRPLLSSYYIIYQEEKYSRNANIVFTTKEDAQRLTYNLNCIEREGEFNEELHDQMSKWLQGFQKWECDKIELTTVSKMMDEATERHREKLLQESFDWDRYWNTRRIKTGGELLAIARKRRASF